MKRALIFIAIFGIVGYSVAQQVQLKGVVTVQNSKTYTGKTQYVKNAEVTHPNAKNDVTDDDGKFTLNITGLRPNIQTHITVIPHGTYSDYVVVNEKELQNITLGRITPVGVYICKKGELEQRQAEMVGVNMRKLEERMEKEQKRLQKELDELKSKNDYLNTRYGEIKDSLDIISKNMDKTFERIKEYAQNMTLENLDDKDDNYVKAYNCFSNGELDSVSYYLNDNELELKHQKILQLQEEAKKERELVEILTESAKAKEEYSENSLNELLKEWLLLARTYAIKNDHEKTIFYYEKVINADSTNVDNIFKYANYLYSTQDYVKAEKYYLQSLEICRELEKENPNTYLVDLAIALNNLAASHKAVNENIMALKEYKEALEIRRKLAEENPKMYLAYVATTLNNLANLLKEQNEYPEALEKYEEALEIRRKLAADDPKYLYDVAITLNNLAIFHREINEDEKSLEEFEESLEIFKKLAADNPKYLSDIARTLGNLAILHKKRGKYQEALAEHTESLDIYRTLSTDNPKVYLPNTALTLNNIAVLHYSLKEYQKAIEEYEEALEIYRTLATDNPKTYLFYVGTLLQNLGNLYRDTNEYQKALELYNESLDIRKKLAADNPKAHSSNVVQTLTNLADLYEKANEYTKALEEYKEALKITETLVIYNPKMYSTWVEEINNYISKCYLYTKDYLQAEQYARQALELNTTSLAKINLAHALLFQNRFPEAETIYKELSQTICEENETCTQILLDNLENLGKANAIPENCKTNVEKIKKMLLEE